jgi:ribosomal protein S30
MTKNKAKENSFFPDIPFIVCRRRKNQPKIAPLICEKRCPRVKNCQEYFDYIQPAMFERYDRREAKEKIREDSLQMGEDLSGPSPSAVEEGSRKRRP